MEKKLKGTWKVIIIKTQIRDMCSQLKEIGVCIGWVGWVLNQSNEILICKSNQHFKRCLYV
jgi:hypothetical protein